jgi:hypothetical protein
MQTLRRRLGIYLRPLAPKEADFEFLFLVVSTVGAASSFVWLASGWPWPGCWFRRLTGLPCPTCGATRSALSLAHGELAAAWGHNPLIFLCYAGTIILDLYCLGVLLFQFPRVRLTVLPTHVKRCLGVFVFAAVALNWVYLLVSR